MVPSVKMMSVVVRWRRREFCSEEAEGLCTDNRGAEQGTTLREYTGKVQEYVNEKSTERS